MLQAEYVRDMHNNYMVLKGMEGMVSTYGVKMLLNNSIPGILKTELRCIDHMDLFYYDMTSKISIWDAFQNKSFDFNATKNILSQIIDVIKDSGDYLLSENDFIIDPNYIFMESTLNKIELCHLVGHQENIQEQLSKFIEYLMNKVDYKDEAAVLLVYAIYKESKEVGCTFEKLLKELDKKSDEPKVKKIKLNNDDKEEKQRNTQNTYNNKKISTDRKDYLGKKDYLEKKDYMDKRSHNRTAKKIPGKNNMEAKYIKDQNNREYNIIQNIRNNLTNSIRSWIDNSNKNKDKVQNTTGTLEEIEVDREICYFGLKIYTLASLSVFIGILTFILVLHFKLLHNPFGTHIDLLKLLCCIMIISSVEVFVFMKLFDKNNKLTRIKTKVEYREPYENQQSMEIPPSDTVNQQNSYCQPDITPQQPGSYHQRDTFFQADPSFQTESCDEVIISKKNTKVDMIHGETQVLWSDQDNSEQDKTVILSKIIPPISYFLIPLNDSDDTKIIVDHFPFVIGKQNTGIDFTVENTSVSRRHVRFTRDGKGVYLTDLNSTNGTFLNGIELTENRPYLITDKDEIMISQVKYVWSVSSKV